MNLAIYDPLPMGNEYCTKMFIGPILAFCRNNSIRATMCSNLEGVKDSHIVILTDHLSEERILMLKNNGNKIVGINVTDSSYISGAIRYAKSLQLVDLIFMVSGVPITNEGSEIAIDETFKVTLVDKPFLDEENWKVFDYMRRAGKLQSLPYVPWTPIPEVPRAPWKDRSQKAILRGGGHARRFLLALHLMRHDKLDINSGFVLHPYFADDMNPAFRYCDACRRDFKANKGHYPYSPPLVAMQCNSPARAYGGPDRVRGEIHETQCPCFTLSDLGQWNNRCPQSFFWMAEQFQKRRHGRGSIDMAVVEKLLNARWLHPKEHQEMLGRILFTSDLKWVHSIYKPQRFWEAAAAGCINVLPLRTMKQEYFPHTVAGVHYMVYEETFDRLEWAFTVDREGYDQYAGAARNLYEQWIAPSIYPVNTNLLAHIINEMRKA